MGTHSGDPKHDGGMFRKWLGLLAKHRGRHADEPVLEPDTEPLSPDVFQPGIPIDWNKVTEFDSRANKRRGIPAPVAIIAAVVLLVMCSLLSTDSGTSHSQPDTGRTPADQPSGGMPSDGAEQAIQTPMAMTAPTSTVTATRTPQRAAPAMVGASGPSPAPVVPSGESPEPTMPTVTTETVTQPAPMTAPNQPRPTVTKTVTVTQTVFRVWPTVTVTVTLSVPGVLH